MTKYIICIVRQERTRTNKDREENNTVWFAFLSSENYWNHNNNNEKKNQRTCLE